mgnify:CR=1 FL=1
MSEVRTKFCHSCSLLGIHLFPPFWVVMAIGCKHTAEDTTLHYHVLHSLHNSCLIEHTPTNRDHLVLQGYLVVGQSASGSEVKYTIPVSKQYNIE